MEDEHDKDADLPETSQDEPKKPKNLKWVGLLAILGTIMAEGVIATFFPTFLDMFEALWEAVSELTIKDVSWGTFLVTAGLGLLCVIFRWNGKGAVVMTLMIASLVCYLVST